jgi:hypothetical protein
MGKFTGNTNTKGQAVSHSIFLKIIQVTERWKLVLCKNTVQGAPVLYPLEAWNTAQDSLRFELKKFDKDRMPCTKILNSVTK